MSDISQARTALIKRILQGEGKASTAERLAAFNNSGLGDAVREFVDKVARNGSKVTDYDIETAKASGLSEDQVFEIVVCAAIGQANRQYETASAALAAAKS